MPFQTERAKFEMQIKVTFLLFFITTALMAAVVYKGDLPAVEKLLDKMMTFFGMVVTYWIGASKGAADARDQLARMLPQAPPPQVAPPPAAVPAAPTQPIKEATQ